MIPRYVWKLTGLCLVVVALIWVNFVLAAPPPAPLGKKPTKTPKTTPTPVYVVIQEERRDYVDTLEIAALSASPDGSAAPIAFSPEDVRAAIDSELPAVWLQVQDRQARNLENMGAYAQGLVSHGNIPANGQQVYPDRYLSHPTDFPASWLDLDILPFSQSPYAYRLDTYNGPNGPGYVFCVMVANGGIWEKCYQYGYEANRAHDWRLLDGEE